MVSKFFTQYHINMRIYIYLLLFISSNLLAQRSNTPSVSSQATTMIGINAAFGVHLPASDMANRFGSDLHVGGGIEGISLSKGWVIGGDAFYFYGKTVKEDVLQPLRTVDGAILGDVGTYANVDLRERGFYTGLNLGKLFKLTDNGNRIGGIRLTLSAGFLQHKIRIQDNSNSAPHLAPPYQAGYDRLTNGFALSQFVGYQIISRDKTINFFVGLDFTEGFTRNRRGFNFDTRQRDDAKRLDILYGARVGWFVPLFTNQKADSIEY